MLYAGDHKRIRLKIGTKADLPPCNQVKELMVSGKMLCIANVNGEIYAADNQCLHWGGPLGQGRIVEGRIACPWHGWTFDPKTGEGPPKAAGRKLPIHPVIIEGDDVFVEVEAAVHARAAF